VKHKKELYLIEDALDKFAGRYSQDLANPPTQSEILRWFHKRDTKESASVRYYCKLNEVKARLIKKPKFEAPHKAAGEPSVRINEKHQEINGQLRRELEHWRHEAEVWKELYQKELIGNAKESIEGKPEKH